MSDEKDNTEKVIAFIVEYIFRWTIESESDLNEVKYKKRSIDDDEHFQSILTKKVIIAQ